MILSLPRTHFARNIRQIACRLSDHKLKVLNDLLTSNDNILRVIHIFMSKNGMP